jgi:hypothetical protein
MKKILTVIASSFIIFSFSTLKADVVIGITAAAHSVDVSGTETLRNSAKTSNTSISEDAVVPEIFAELVNDNGLAFGVAYIPVREMGSKTRTDAGSDPGDYKANAELENVLQAYVDVPIYAVGPGAFYGKLGIQHATVSTLESLNAGSSYPDEDLFGYTVGLGYKGDLPVGNGLIYKLDATYTDFEDYSSGAADGNGNKIDAELEDTALKISIGKRF